MGAYNRKNMITGLILGLANYPLYWPFKEGRASLEKLYVNILPTTATAYIADTETAVSDETRVTNLISDQNPKLTLFYDHLIIETQDDTNDTGA